jgi:hypothetical protein
MVVSTDVAVQVQRLVLEETTEPSQDAVGNVEEQGIFKRKLEEAGQSVCHSFQIASSSSCLTLYSRCMCNV